MSLLPHRTLPTRLCLLALFVLTIAIVTAPPAARADRAPDAGAFLAALGERAVLELTDKNVDEVERERRFRHMFTESVDVVAIGRFVVGRHWRQAEETDRLAFLQVFEDAVVQRFMPMFADYSGETFAIDQLRRDTNNPQHVFVSSIITLSSGEPVTVEWRVREKDSGYQILDIIAEGVSMAITLRQEYSAVIRRFGLDGLTERLRAKVGAGAFAPKKASTE